MERTYTVDVSPYPKTYNVVASSEEEARMIAKERFADDTNGASVYESTVIDVS